MQAVLDWRVVEARITLLVAAYAALFGAVVGVVWHAIAPAIAVARAINGSEAASKSLIGDDAWLALLGIAAGVVCVLMLFLVSPHAAVGPGAQLGLAVGGFLGMLVAARVGHLVGHHAVVSAVAARFPHATPAGIGQVASIFDFRVRAKGVLFAWPIASVFLCALIEWIRALKEPTPLRAAAYPGSP